MEKYIQFLKILLCVLVSTSYTTCQHVSTIYRRIKKIKTLPRHLVQRKKRITKKIHTPYFMQEQMKLLRHFSATHHKAIRLEEFQEGITILKQGNTFPVLKNTKPILRAALPQFYKTEGFTRVMKLVIVNLKNEYSFGGYVYELEKGLEINRQDNTETVIAFEKTLKHPHTQEKSEFDIITNQRYLECKNTRWTNTCRAKKQIKKQQRIVDARNQHDGTEYTYELCSKQQIPHNLQEWCSEQNIRFSSDEFH